MPVREKKRRASHRTDPIELASDPDAGDRGVRNQRQALAAAIVDHDEDAQTTAIDELVGNDIERPAFVRRLWDQHWCPRAQGPFPAASTTNDEPFLAVKPEQAFMVHDEALPSQQHVQAPIAEPPALMRQRPKPLSQLGVIRSTRTIAHRHPHAADDFARPPLAHLERRTNMSDSFSLGGGRHHFFARRILQRSVVQHRIGQKLLQLGVLAFQAPQALRVGDLETAVLGLPVIKRLFADHLLAAQIGRLHSSLVLLQDRNDLFFQMPLALHRLILSYRPDSNSPWINSRGQRHLSSVRQTFTQERMRIKRRTSGVTVRLGSPNQQLCNS